MRDADIITNQLTDMANTASRMRRQGVCFHLSTVTPINAPARCRDCGRTWPDSDALDAERDELMAEHY
jgi:hypothetical protein